MKPIADSVRSCLQSNMLRVFGIIAIMLFTSMAQAFQLQNLEKERVNLMDYVGDGRWTLIMFWATDCIPCEQQKPAFEVFHRQHKDSLASVVGIVIDGLEHEAEAAKLIDHHQPTYPNLVALSDVFHRQYQELVGKQFRITPTYLVFDPQGNLQGNIYGNMDFNALSQHIQAQN